MSYCVTNHRTGTKITVNDDETVLDAALRAGVLFPYGCKSGICGSCKTQLTAGKVHYGRKGQTTSCTYRTGTCQWAGAALPGKTLQ